MEDFAARVIAAHQAGLSERRSKEQHANQQEEFKLAQQVKKLELDQLKVQAALHQRQIQGTTSGGPTGQATVETPTIQPPPGESTPASIADILQGLPRQVATQPMPIQGLSQSVETGTPPALPDIESPAGTIPGTNLEMEQQRGMAEFLRGLKMKAIEETQKAQIQRQANDYTVTDPTTGQAVTAPKDIIDNILTQTGENKRAVDQRKFTAEENKKRLEAETTQKQLDRAASMARTQAAASSRIAAATAGQGRTAALSSAQKFGTEPQVKNFQVIQEASAFVNSLPDNTDQSADDQALLYSFAKAMDPNSVVREGEYATVQKYAQSWAATYGFKAKRIFETGPFLTEEARKQMKATITKRVAAAQKSYDTIFNEYTRNLNRITGQNNGKDLLIDYSFGAPTPTTPSGVPDVWTLPDGTVVRKQPDGTYK